MDLSFLDYLDTIEGGDLTSAAIVEMEGTFFYPLASIHLGKSLKSTLLR